MRGFDPSRRTFGLSSNSPAASPPFEAVTSRAFLGRRGCRRLRRLRHGGDALDLDFDYGFKAAPCFGPCMCVGRPIKRWGAALQRRQAFAKPMTARHGVGGLKDGTICVGFGGLKGSTLTLYVSAAPVSLGRQVVELSAALR